MKIPPQAKRVFKGIIYDVYQWEQADFKGALQVYEALKRPGSVQILAIKDDKILISQEEQPGEKPFFALFGGRMEEGENPLEAAKREFLEETGMEAENCEVWFSCNPSGKIDWTIHYFVARGCHKVADQKLDGGEKITVGEYAFEDFLNLLEQKSFRGTEALFDLRVCRFDQEKKRAYQEWLFRGGKKPV